MTRRTNVFRTGLVIACLMVVLTSVALMAVTPAGTTIQTTATAQYKSSSGTQMPTATSNTVTVTVGQMVAIGVSPSSATKTADGSLSASYGLTVTNNGSGSDTLDLTATAKSGSTATIYVDDNADGTRQSTETTVASSTGALPIGGTFKCVVVVKLPTTATVTTDTVTFSAKSRSDATKTSQSLLTIERGVDKSFIQSWLVNGYYPNTDLTTQMSTDYLGGESGMAPAESDISGGKVWTRLDSTTPYVDLWTKYGKPTYCVGYAFAYVNSPSDQTVYMKTGSDDGIKVWVNGTAVQVQDVQRGYAAESETAGIDLASGWNRILVKLTQKNWDWGFSLKLCDANGNAVPDLEYSLVGDPGSGGGGGTDTTPPAISNVRVTTGTTTATVEWDTDEASTTVADYGTSTTLGTSYTDSVVGTHHTAGISGLTANTTYYIKVGGADASGNVAMSAATTFTTTAISTGPATFIQSWLVNGFYSNTDATTRMTQDYLGGEAAVGPTQGATSGGKVWSKLTSTVPYMNMWVNYGKPLNCAGYAFTYINSPSDQTVYMKTGSDDGIKVWVNGAVVLNKDVYRGYVAETDSTQINLNAGWNKVLVKVTQGNWDWGFSMKICDSAGSAVQGLEYSLVPTSADDVTAPVISNVKVTPSATTATIEWTTDEPSSTLADYGTTTSLGTDYTDTVMTMSHTMTLTGLTAGATYYVKVGSADANGNTNWSGPHTVQTAPTPSTNAYIRSWLLNAYYANSSTTTRMTQDYIGGEATVTPRSGLVSGGKTWTVFNSTANYVNLWTNYGKPLNCAGYAAAYVYASSAKTVYMRTGSDDGIKVWLNGTVVLNKDVYRSYVADQDNTAINLKAGWNKILVKASQGTWDWGFSFKLCDSAGNRVPDLAFSTTPQ